VGVISIKLKGLIFKIFLKYFFLNQTLDSCKKCDNSERKNKNNPNCKAEDSKHGAIIQ